MNKHTPQPTDAALLVRAPALADYIGRIGAVQKSFRKFWAGTSSPNTNPSEFIRFPQRSSAPHSCHADPFDHWIKQISKYQKGSHDD